MFATKNDLKNNIYNYQIAQITEGDDSIVLQALETAIEEVRSYIEVNSRKEYLDGRPRYDVVAIFSAEAGNRNALILNHVITVAKWYIVDLSNVDILYEVAKERYDRAISWLKKLNQGDVNLSSLPLIGDTTSQENTEGTDSTNLEPFAFGSRPKFNHE